MYNPFFVHPFFNILAVVVLLWTIPWKIYALWTAAKHGHKKWFVALVILNTLSILEIFYVFKIAKKSQAEVKRAFSKAFSSIIK